MNILEKCSKNQALIQRMFGFTEEQIEAMTKQVRKLWKDAEIKRKMRENRIRKITEIPKIVEINKDIVTNQNVYNKMQVQKTSKKVLNCIIA